MFYITKTYISALLKKKRKRKRKQRNYEGCLSLSKRENFLYRKIGVMESLVKLSWYCFCYEMADLPAFTFCIYDCDWRDNRSGYISP